MAGRRFLSIFASISWSFLVLHGWYRDLRKKSPVVRIPPPEPPKEKTPVLIVADSRAEAEDIAELLGDDHVMVAYRPKTRYDRLRES